MTSLNIEIYSDLICPWCYIGRRKLEAGIKLLDASEPPNILWRPFELNPEMPKAGLDRKAYRSAKFGSWERSQSMDRDVAATGKTLGLEFKEEEQEARRRGLNGVPFFVINGIPAFSGAQRPDIFVETFRQVLGAEARRCGSESCSV